MDDELIDLCRQYIEDKGFNYLAKEGQIVHFMSVTGRKSDFIWHKYGINEILRIIKAMKLSSEQAKELREHHLISAFQELGRVYEFGVKSRHTTAEGIFNYTEHSEMSLGDEAMGLLVEYLQANGFSALIMRDVIDVFSHIDNKLKLKLSSKEQRELMYKHFESAGFLMKTGANRPLIFGRKQPAIIMPKAKPAEVVEITLATRNSIVAKIYGELA